MAKNLPGSIPSETLGLLGDIFRKTAKGVFTHDELALFAKRRNPFPVVAEVQHRKSVVDLMIEANNKLILDRANEPKLEPVTNELPLKFTGFCKHCEDGISGEGGCSVCGQRLIDQCVMCHKEIAHDIIKNQNIHIVGSGGGQNGLDRDPDAFGRADN